MLQDLPAVGPGPLRFFCCFVFQRCSFRVCGPGPGGVVLLGSLCEGRGSGDVFSGARLDGLLFRLSGAGRAASCQEIVSLCFVLGPRPDGLIDCVFGQLVLRFVSC